MQLIELLRLVLINIKQNKGKVFLTSLGIIVGTATIVMVIAIGEGGKQDVAEQFKTLNAGTITISEGVSTLEGAMAGGGGMPMGGGPSSGGGQSRSSGGSSSSSSASRTAQALASANDNTLTEENMEDILFFVPNITSAALSATAEHTVTGGDLEDGDEYTVVGTEPNYATISNLNTVVGSFITETDLETTSRSVVIGYSVALDMFDSLEEAYDEKIQIDGRDYVINGVLGQMGTIVADVNPDEAIYMAYSTAEKYIFERNYSPQITLLAADVAYVEEIIENITAVLAQSNPDTTFSIEDAGATMDAAMESANTLSMLLMAIAAIVFIVGGIGIMNVLFVSVKERTREIGILKAIGTSKFDILMLFLLEANTIGVIGGVLGVIVSFAVIPLMEYTDITVVMSVEAVLLALMFAIVTGTIFGFYPAWRASNLIPIQALNND